MNQEDINIMAMMLAWTIATIVSGFGFLLPVIAIGIQYGLGWGVLAFILPFIVTSEPYIQAEVATRGFIDAFSFIPIIVWVVAGAIAVFSVFEVIWGVITILIWLYSFSNYSGTWLFRYILLFRDLWLGIED